MVENDLDSTAHHDSAELFSTTLTKNMKASPANSKPQASGVAAVNGEDESRDPWTKVHLHLPLVLAFLQCSENVQVSL